MTIFEAIFIWIVLAVGAFVLTYLAAIPFVDAKTAGGLAALAWFLAPPVVFVAFSLAASASVQQPPRCYCGRGLPSYFRRSKADVVVTCSVCGESYSCSVVGNDGWQRCVRLLGAQREPWMKRRRRGAWVEDNDESALT